MRFPRFVVRAASAARSKASASAGARIGVRTMAFSPVAFTAGIGGIAAMIAGHTYNWMEIKAAGIFGIVCLLVALLLTAGRSSFQVELSLAQDDVQVGQRAFGRLNVSNTGRRRTMPVLVELPVGRAQADFSVPMLAPSAQHEELFAIPTRKRAVINVGPVKSVRSDPLGMIRREVVWTEVEQLFVHPNTVNLEGPAAGVVRDLDGQTLRTVTDNDMNFHALREYVPGDDRRSIHWKSSARNQKLMVRQFEDTRRTHIALALETDVRQFGDPQSFELGVSVLASLGLNTIRGGLERTVFAGPHQVRTTSPVSFLNATSGIEQTSGNPVAGSSSFGLNFLVRDVSTTSGGTTGGSASAGELLSGAETISRWAPSASLAVVITGTTTDIAQLRTDAMLLPAGVRTVFIRCGVGLEERIATHDQVSFVDLGRLDQLPKVLRAAVLS